ncbi:helix-turn-helix domain-containing protein [Anaerocolumna sp. MB42-C2]|uniref:helix-turn-helix domain-containing protein n=1 Tax=Anaerocolumna sp. MB42-C2 TaxID=3070997 RepID=UPI0027DFBB4B|nr:AraC family transcriptional regulator [Anaerocolumna sp. MB42-C2]WMJ89701.1 AraC family transcriptional regulator [Anaerocolumna sp. MB42-C2]
MLNISGYLNEYDEEIVDTQNNISVNSCGHYKLISLNKFETQRPLGRQDYQLLYVAHGFANFLIRREMVRVPAESFVLYYPGEGQHYNYCLEDRTDLYWVHFSGVQITELLKKYNLYPHHLFHVNTGEECKRIFDKIILELQLKRTNFFSLINVYFEELVLLLSRQITEGTKESGKSSELIEQAIEYFHKEYRNELSIEKYARSCNISCCWFIRSFKKHTGTTPGQYLLDIRINKAKELLKNGTFNISETAEFVGFDNPLYFSRIFKKNVGISPSEYLKKQQPYLE